MIKYYYGTVGDRVTSLEQLIKLAEQKKALARIGELTLRNEYLRDSESKRSDWLRKAKTEAGYHDSVSFDIVWKETLEKAKKYDMESEKK